MRWVCGVLAVLCLAVIAGCSGSGAMVRQIDPALPRTIYIEPITGDGYGINGRLEMAALKAGFDPVADQARASFKMRATFMYGWAGSSAVVRVSDTTTNDTIYVGEGKMSGFSNAFDPGSIIWGCFERALADLK